MHLGCDGKIVQHIHVVEKIEALEDKADFAALKIDIAVGERFTLEDDLTVGG